FRRLQLRREVQQETPLVGCEVEFLEEAAVTQVERHSLLLCCVALDGTAHAPGTTAAAAEFAAGDRHHLDAVPTQVRVGRDVALVAEDDAGLDGEEVAAVVPLLALRGPLVLVGPED